MAFFSSEMERSGAPRRWVVASVSLRVCPRVKEESNHLSMTSVSSKMEGSEAITLFTSAPAVFALHVCPRFKEEGHDSSITSASSKMEGKVAQSATVKSAPSEGAPSLEQS
eukprot:CAMPEP_0171677888 /NCGR_PEP_ID=MMETSP0990-20121206/55342_1 /TAXON_ID=483369 /ORGANISM="non described non described, Strain CCMP2098" /LENGTH=110 /DNA_ID=CAMNT_0012264433 /DNA_START=164 /DNA_END=493 /DNA_ORIENTATION=+